MRIQWTEKARRLAEKYNLYDMGESDIELLLECRFPSRNKLKAVGVIDEDGNAIWWHMKDKLIDVVVELNPRIGAKIGSEGCRQTKV